MPIPTDTYWNIKRLNVVFAATAVLLLAVMGAAVVQDYNKTWREPQKAGRVWEAALTEEKISQTLTPERQQELTRLDQEIAAADARVDRNKAQIDQAAAAVRAQESEITTLQFQFNTLKANVTVDESRYEAAKTDGNAESADAYARSLPPRRKELADEAEKLAALKDQLKEKKAGLVSLTKERDAAQKEKGKKLTDREALATKRAALEPEGLLATVAAKVRATPLMQFINPAERVDSKEIPEVQQMLGTFKTVGVTDRCTTCHVNIAKKEMTEEKVVGFLERQLAADRAIKFPPPPTKAEDPKAQADAPGAAAMPEFWHAWGKKLLPPAAFAASFDAPLNQIVAAAGPVAKGQAAPRGVIDAAKAAVAQPSNATDKQRDERDKIIPALLDQLYSHYDALQQAAESSTAADKPSKQDLEAARRAALIYPAQLREAVLSRLKPDAARLLMDRYRRALVARVNVGRKNEKRETLDDGRVMLAHPRLDLYCDPDSKHPIESTESRIGVGCTGCHDGSGQETNFVLAAHVPRHVWVDEKTGEPVLPSQLTRPPEEDERPTLASMIKAVYPEGAMLPAKVPDLHLNLDAAPEAAGGSGGAAPAADLTVAETAPEKAPPTPYADPVTGAAGRAIPQGIYWADKYEAEAGRSFELVYEEWDWPMRPPQYLQANCVRCHNNVNDIREHAPVVYEGRNLFNTLGCVNCHQMDSIPAAERRQVGTDLRHVRDKLSPEFVNTWIWAPKSFRPSTKMPHFFMLENNSSDEELRRSRQEARAITEYLVQTSTPLPPKHVMPAGLAGKVDEGKQIFRSVGCMACHADLNLPAVDPADPAQELEGVTVGQQWITTDLIRKGELEKRVRPAAEKATAEAMKAELPTKALQSLVDDAKKRLTKDVSGEDAFKPKNAKKPTKAEKDAITKEVEKRLKAPAEQDKIKAALPQAVKDAEATLAQDVQAALPDAIASAVGAEAKRLFDAMSYNERQVYVLENLESPGVILGTNDTPRYADGTPKPLFIHHGPELSGIGTKLLDHRTPEQAKGWLFDWLKEPRHYSGYTVMPNLRLSDQQAASLVEFLLSQQRGNVKTLAAEEGKEPKEIPDAWSAGLAQVDSAKLIELTAFFLRSRFSVNTAAAKADDKDELRNLAIDALTTPGRDKDAAAAMVDHILNGEVAAPATRPATGPATNPAAAPSPAESVATTRAGAATRPESASERPGVGGSNAVAATTAPATLPATLAAAVAPTTSPMPAATLPTTTVAMTQPTTSPATTPAPAVAVAPEPALPPTDSFTPAASGVSPKDELRLIFLGKKLVGHYGCMSCHSINGAETITSPCANLSDWGQKQVTKLDYAYLDPHKAGERKDQMSVPMVNGLADGAAWLAHAPARDAAAPVVVAWPEVQHTRESWLTQKLKNTRIWDRGRMLLEPGPQNLDDVLGKPYDKLRMPTFYLNDGQVNAIVTFVLSNRDRLVTEKLLARANDEAHKQIAYGRYLTQKYNCTSCHQTETNVPMVQQYYKPDELTSKAPPSLRGEGNKIQFDWLVDFLYNVEPMRPTLQPSGGIRMPSFPFDEKGEEAKAIAAYFAAASNKEAGDLKQWLDPVQKYEESARKAEIERTGGGPAGRNPRTGPATRPAGTPPPSGGSAVATAGGEPKHNDAPAPPPPTAVAGGPAQPPAENIAPGRDWFKAPTLAASVDALKRWSIETREMKPADFDPFRKGIQPGDLEANYASLLYKAKYLGVLYDAPYPFVTRDKRKIDDEEFKRGEGLFYTVGCISCHTISPPTDEEGPPPAGVIGPNLARANARLQRRWARYWVQEPPLIQIDTKMTVFFTGLGSLNTGGEAWHPKVSENPGVAQQVNREFDARYGGTAADQINHLLNFVYAAGPRGYTAIRPGTPGAPAAWVPSPESLVAPPAPATQPGVQPPDTQPVGGGHQSPEHGPTPTSTQPYTAGDASTGGPASRPAPEAKPPAPAAPEGGGKPSVNGKATFVGKPPKAAVVSAIAGVRECAEQHSDPMRDESLVVNEDGTIANVVVSVSSGLAPASYPVPREPAVLDQKGCQYRPHVLGMRVGQPLLAANSDPFLHNVHTQPQANESDNKPQPNKDPGSPLKPVKTAETFHVKCDVHPWMGAWVAAFDHPFFAVTGDDGSFSLAGLPPGKYVITAWHETLGEQKKEVTVKEGEPADVEFVFEKK